MVTKARAALAGVVFLVAFLTRPPTAAEPAEQPLERRFAEIVQPFLKNYCLSCHSGEKPKGKLDLAGYTTAAAVVKHERIWERVIERLEAGEMPPEKAPRQPKPHERRAVLDWLRDVREQEAQRHAGDPGVVLARRL